MKKLSIQRWRLLRAPEKRLELHLHQTLNVLKSRTQLVLGLLAAGLILLTAWQTGDFNLLKEKIALLKSLFK